MTTLFFCSLLPGRMFDSLRGVSHKVLDETDNLQKPNPPAPLPYQGRGVSKPIPASGLRCTHK
jgi:hypothetical protein